MEKNTDHSLLKTVFKVECMISFSRIALDLKKKSQMCSDLLSLVLYGAV